MIELFTSETPNGWKVSIALEEMALPYTVHHLHLTQQEQKADWYLKINPNGRIPAIVDHDNADFAVFESGAILMYLAQKTGQFIPADPAGQSRVLQWIMWQVGGLGPMMGQSTVFHRYFAEDLPAVKDRYRRESERLFGVLDSHLAQQEYLVGDYSIADMCSYPWVNGHTWAQVDIDPFPHLKRWHAAIRARPGVQRGMQVPQSAQSQDETVTQGKTILA